MDSCSEGSFAWTDASNDSSDDDSMAKSNLTSNQSGEESESGKTYKKKLQQRLFSGGREQEPAAEPSTDHEPGKRKISRTLSEDLDNRQTPGRKRFKAEPESEAELPKKKKKKSLDSNDLYDESFLNSKVKHEKSHDVESPRKTKKNKKKDESGANHEINGHLTYPEVQPPASPLKPSNGRITFEESTSESKLPGEEVEHPYNEIKTRKKKKSKKSFTSEEDYVHNGVGEDGLQALGSSSNERLIEPADGPSDALHSLDREESDENETKNKSKESTENIDVQNRSVMINSDSLIAKRKSRMSERIQFEEEESDVHEQNTTIDSTTIPQQPTNNTKLKCFLESGTELRLLHTKLPSAVVFSKLDDIWLIRCPKDVKPEFFQDKKWTLDAKCKIKLDGQSYEGDVDGTGGAAAVLTRDRDHRTVLRNAPIQACIRLRRRLPKCHPPEDNIMLNNQTNFIPLPDTKCRHPLFGSHYKKAMKLPAAVAERLRAPRAAAGGGGSRARRARATARREAEAEAPPCKPERGEAPDAPPPTKKKKKKRKHSDAAAEDAAPRPKKSKRNLESAEAWDSEKAIEENLFNF